MNPWDVIGWLVLVVIGAMVGTMIVGLGGWLLASARERVRHVRTRDIPPAVGQRWRDPSGRVMRVTEHYVSTDRWGVRIGSLSMGLDADEFAARVRSRRAWLESSS